VEFQELDIPGVFLVGFRVMEDERGSFARTFCIDEFAARGLCPRVVQCSESRNRAVGTLRGMHFQIAPHEEAKLVTCVRGAIYDVILDLRPASPSFGKWVSVELSEGGRQSVYIPEGCAHGFQTLMDDSTVHYQMSTAYDAASARGVRPDDPAFGIRWPLAISSISDRDRSFPLWADRGPTELPSRQGAVAS
jgi:dTDP-4-dehydrorhamnose 3,5-epimerase